MAVILRETKDGWVALCAARNPVLPEDIYLDDAQDHALRKKYLADYESEGLIDGTCIHEEES